MPAVYVLWFIRRRGPSSISVPKFMWIALFVQKLLRGSQNLEIRSRDPGHANCRLRGHFVTRLQGGSVLYVCTKFQADISFRSKVIRGSQNFEVGSRDPDHAHLEVAIYSVRWRGPSSISISNFKQMAFSFTSY